MEIFEKLGSAFNSTSSMVKKESGRSGRERAA